MGLKITTDGKPVTVYRQDKTSSAGNPYATYSVMVSSKDKDGNWHNGFIEAKFKYGTDLPNKTKININNAFYTVDEYNEKTYPKLFINDFAVEGAQANPNTATDPTNDWMNIAEDVGELPFN